jgi:peptide/nickel transport system substrate-binding protein
MSAAVKSRSSSSLLQIVVLFFFSVTVVALLAGCAATPTPIQPAKSPPGVMAAPSPTTIPTPAPAPGGQVIVGGPGLAAFNSLLADDEGSRAVSRLLFDSLLAVDPATGALQPGLAEDWEFSADNRAMNFRLRSGPRWHDGQPLTAQDVVFTLETARQLASQKPHLADFAALGAIGEADGHTVTVNLDEPGCTLLYQVGLLPILPRHLLEAGEIEGDPFNSAPVGSGPFVFAGGNPGQQVTLERNPAYWGQTPHLERWSYRVFTDTQALADALAAGEVDVAALSWDAPALLPHGDFAFYPYPAAEYLFIAFNSAEPTERHFIFGDRRVRQAFSLALDRERILEQVLDGQGVPISGPFLPGYWATDEQEIPPYDPAKARELLAAAGWADSDGDGILDRQGKPLRFFIHVNGENEVRQGIAALAQQYYRAIGADAGFGPVEWGGFLDYIFTHDFDAVVFSWPLSPEPDQRRFWRSDQGAGFNFVSYSNPQLDALLDEGATLSGCSPARRAQIYSQVAALLAEERPYDFLFAPHAFLVASPRIGGIAPSAFAGPYWNVADWHISNQ